MTDPVPAADVHVTRTINDGPPEPRSLPSSSLVGRILREYRFTSVALTDQQGITRTYTLKDDDDAE